MSKPVGYICPKQLDCLLTLKGSEYETSGRCYMPFSLEPFKSDISDCSMPVYSQDKLPHIENLQEAVDVYWDFYDEGTNQAIGFDNFEQRNAFIEAATEYLKNMETEK